MASAGAADLLPGRDLKSLAVQKYWDTQVPLAGGAKVSKLVLLDDAAYVLTDTNVVYALHAPTGVIRWSNLVGEAGQVVRGPTHGKQFAYFTAPGSVHVMNRQTGEPTGEPRTLHGAIIDVVHDTATIAIGANHGVRLGDVLDVKRRLPNGELEQDAVATLRITVVDPKKAKGRLTRLTTARRAGPGDVATANVLLPLPEVNLPFAASSAAVGDETSLYVGASNQRFYSLGILNGFQHWQLLTPKTVSATPVLIENAIYIVGQDGRVICLNKEDRTGNWTFDTEGPIFAKPLVDKDRVYVASTDRSLYGLDAKTGRRIWRERFDTPLREAPVVCEGRLFQRVPERGLFVMDAATGKALWHRQEPASFMAQFGQDAYLFDDEVGATLIRVDAATGKVRAEVGVDPVAFAAASQVDQSVVLATAQGQIICLRSEKAPRLTPARLAEALRNDAKIQARAKAEAEQKAATAKAPAAEETKPPTLLLEDDWLTSTSKTEPLGGRAVGTPEAKERAAAKEEGKEKVAPEEEGEEEAATDEAGMEEGEEESKDAAASEEEGEGDDEAAGEEASEDEEKTGEEDKEEGGDE
jgi:outer membrane protein assembly factor BamB